MSHVFLIGTIDTRTFFLKKKSFRNPEGRRPGVSECTLQTGSNWSVLYVNTACDAPLWHWLHRCRVLQVVAVFFLKSSSSVTSACAPHTGGGWRSGVHLIALNAERPTWFSLRRSEHAAQSFLCFIEDLVRVFSAQACAVSRQLPRGASRFVAARCHSVCVACSVSH